MQTALSACSLSSMHKNINEVSKNVVLINPLHAQDGTGTVLMNTTHVNIHMHMMHGISSLTQNWNLYKLLFRTWHTLSLKHMAHTLSWWPQTEVQPVKYSTQRGPRPNLECYSGSCTLTVPCSHYFDTQPLLFMNNIQEHNELTFFYRSKWNFQNNVQVTNEAILAESLISTYFCQ